MIRRLLPFAFLLFAFPSHAALRPGAPRALRLNPPLLAPFVESSQVALLSRDGSGYDLVFGGSGNGALNLYRATRRDFNNAKSPWRAAALTQFATGVACFAPVALPDGSGLLCVWRQDMKAGANRGKVARFDLQSGGLTPLFEDARCQGPSVSPDGRRVAWNSDTPGAETVYVSTEGGRPRRIATPARSAAWADSNTLLYESLRDGSRGVYRVRLTPEGRRSSAQPGDALVWARGGQACVSPDGETLCVAAQNDDGEANLYLLSADGSGARAATGTMGARHPRFLPDGSGILYDAPLPDSRARTLWMLPLRTVTPVAALLEARPMRDNPGTLEIYGTAWCEGEDTRAFISVGQGETPAIYTDLAAVRTPAHESLLGRWTPPRGATGTWTLRLRVRTVSGEETENTLPLQLPLADGRPLEVAPLPVAPPVAPAVVAPARPVSPRVPVRSRNVPATPVMRSVPTPRPTAATPRVSPVAPSDSSVVASPASPVILPVIPPRRSRNTVAPKRRRVTMRPKVDAPPEVVARETETTESMSENTAQTDVTGTPAIMRAGETVSVSARLRNTGTRAWTPSGSDTVRLVARWQDLERGYRARWQFVWPREATRPGEQTRVIVPLTAPRAGRYKLTFFLVRAASGSVRAPSSRGDNAWPGEFGLASYLVVVR